MLAIVNMRLIAAVSVTRSWRKRDLLGPELFALPQILTATTTVLLLAW